MEERYEVITVRVRKRCTECYDGEMQPDGRTLMSSPPQYPHTCSNCGHKENLRHIYPYIDYEEKEYFDNEH